MAEFILGMNAKLYRAAALVTAASGSAFAASSWTEITNTKDVTVNTDKAEADVTTRANNGWRAIAGTLKQLTVEWEMQWKSSDTGFVAVKNAYLNNTEICLAVMDGAIATTGNQGPAGNFTITGFSREEPLEGAVVAKVTAKFSSFQYWYTVGSS